jgi:hypothetical protein
MIRKSDVRDWMNNPITERLFDLIKQAKEISNTNLINGSTLKANFTAEATAHEVGFNRALELILNAELYDEDPEEEKENV